ncbi:Cyanophycin synthetase [Pseudovibrio axinellae]|uniref:Cyanophycin synthetase n=1 Tax=Pseudovibrio axinellae TaxID=989403 RepID=A0A165ZQC8_9HYPH|nr:cyanophycin synthetase [Pseudovibrio axinellae]KZL20147.1 Cyanophycin synthetase [Pseudovibrio axinellae]SEQ23295.1 RimK-like ATP-grasp domain-containing protein [Pseudovibrio axinellae]
MLFAPVSPDQPNLPLAPRLLAQLCQKKKVKLALDSEFFYFGYIETAKGIRFPIKGGAFALNSYAAGEAARDKEFCGRLLHDAGLPTPQFQLIHSDRAIRQLSTASPHVADRLNSLAKAQSLAEQFGYPLFIKPNEGTQGIDVHKINTPAALQEHLAQALEHHERMLIQQAVTGNDYRVIVLDGKVLAAIERQPLSIQGNGSDTILRLLAEKLQMLTTRSGGHKIERGDPRLLKAIQDAGYQLNSIVPNGQILPLLSNANLSTGGTAIDVTDHASPHFKDLAIKAAQACGLQYAGVDILCEDLSLNEGAANVLELNAGPGLTNFWQASPDHHDRIRAIYEGVLDAILSTKQPSW